MRKLLLMALALFFLATSVALAEDVAGKWSIGAIINGVFPDDDDMDEMLSYGGVLEYNFTSYLAGEVELSYAESDDQLESVKFGEVSYLPLLFNLKARYPEGELNPFVFAGVGAMFVDYEEEQWVKDLGIGLDVDTGLAYQIGAGLDYFLTDNAALFTRLGYLWSEVEAEAQVAGYSEAADVELNQFFAGGGIKVMF